MSQTIVQPKILVTLPQPVFEAAAVPSAEEGFNVEASGTGTFTGLAYSIPAHATGQADIRVNVMALGSENLKSLNESIMTLLNASQQKTVEEHSKTSAHADLSLWDILGFGGSAGGSASYEHSTNSMETFGLSEEQITQIIAKFFDVAKTMSHVELRLTIENRYDYAVHGGLELYTMSGQIKTAEGSKQYRLLSNEGSAGVPGQQAPAHGEIVPLK